MNTRSPRQQPFLAADVGGTNARMALMAPGIRASGPVVLAYRVYRCAEYASLADIVRAFREELTDAPRQMVLACTGCADGGVVINDSLPWPIVPAAMAEALGLSEVVLLNDFEALAHAAAYIDTTRSPQLNTSPHVVTGASGPVVVVGPGTGLGAAVRLPGTPPTVLATEAGQIQLAARVGREQEVMRMLALPDTYVSYEHVLSGPGLLRVYRALCASSHRAPMCSEPSAVTAAALDGSDTLAVETLNLFCGWLGSFVGDLAMLYQATGGIYLAGGFLSGIVEFLRASSFAERFLDKGVMRPFLEKVPVRVVDHGQLGVIGAASWFLDRASLDPVEC
ncbi:glucokinase [Dyella subtropica]|uniref:glucokinase n=1 Tax=Dyella subtropica TaxID=2992127 RepID=UPI00225BA3B3|nr:glucokinase [Dyella subtropica]